MTDDRWSRELKPDVSHGFNLRFYALPLEIRTAASSAVQAARRFTLGDTAFDQFYRAQFARPATPDSIGVLSGWHGSRLLMRCTLWANNTYLADVFRKYDINHTSEPQPENSGASFATAGTREEYTEMTLASEMPCGWLSSRLFPSYESFVAVLSPELENALLTRWNGSNVDADAALADMQRKGFGWTWKKIGDTLILKPMQWPAHVSWNYNAKAVNRFATSYAHSTTHIPFLDIVREAGTTYGRTPWIFSWRQEFPESAPLAGHVDEKFRAWTYGENPPAGPVQTAARAFLHVELGTPTGLTPIATVAISSLPSIIGQIGKFIVSMREKKAKTVSLEMKLEELAVLLQESAKAQAALQATVAELETRLAAAEAALANQRLPWWKRRTKKALR